LIAAKGAVADRLPTYGRLAQALPRTGQRVSDERSGDDLLQQPRMIARNATMTNLVHAGRA